jgi:hypothetical protein
MTPVARPAASIFECGVEASSDSSRAFGKYRLKLSAQVGVRRVTLSWDEYAFVDIRDLTFMFSDVERDKGMVMAEAKGMAGLGNRGYL